MAKDIKPSNVEPRANMESDRANRINSLHRSVDTAVKHYKYQVRLVR